MRGAGLAFIGVFGSLAALIFSAVIGANESSWFVFFFMLVISGGGVYALYKWVWSMGRIDMTDWLASVSQCKYKYAWDGSGVAVDGATRTLHVASKFQGRMVTKTYPFSDVREWEYNIEGRTNHQLFGRHGLETHLQVGIANVAAEVDAAEKTGFSVKVADIDYPKWFIKFRPQKNLETELARWMEIFQQHVNEGA